MSCVLLRAALLEILQDRLPQFFVAGLPVS
jgi:hypothetical protein